MHNKVFTKLLQDTGLACETHMKLCVKVNEEWIRRHEVTYSNVAADSIIDVLNYIGGSITAEEFDKIMITTMIPTQK